MDLLGALGRPSILSRHSAMKGSEESGAAGAHIATEHRYSIVVNRLARSRQRHNWPYSLFLIGLRIMPGNTKVLPSSATRLNQRELLQLSLLMTEYIHAIGALSKIRG